MSTDFFDKIMGILERNNYQIVLTTTNSGFSIQYPEKMEFPPLKSKMDNICIYDDSISYNNNIIQVPKYLQTSYCISLMVRGCKKYGYSAMLCRYINNNKDVNDEDFWKLVPFNLSSEEEELSDEVPRLINMCTENETEAMSLAEEMGIEEGLKIILSLLKEKIDE